MLLPKGTNKYFLKRQKLGEEHNIDAWLSGHRVEKVMSALTPTGYKLLTFRESCTFLSIIRKKCQLCFYLKSDFACTPSNFCRGGDPIFSNWSLETNQIPNDDGKSAHFPSFSINKSPVWCHDAKQINSLHWTIQEFWQAQVRLNMLWCQCCGYGGGKKRKAYFSPCCLTLLTRNSSKTHCFTVNDSTTSRTAF